MPVALETVDLEKHFGGIAAVAGVSLRIEKGARHALIGPNGAGKTTVINLLTGVVRPSAGRILLDGEDITALESYRRLRRGLARTSQGAIRLEGEASTRPESYRRVPPGWAATSRSNQPSPAPPRFGPSGSRSPSAWARARTGGGWSAPIPPSSRKSWKFSHAFI